MSKSGGPKPILPLDWQATSEELSPAYTLWISEPVRIQIANAAKSLGLAPEDYLSRLVEKQVREFIKRSQIQTLP